MSKVAIIKTVSSENKQSKNPLNRRKQSLGSIGTSQELLKVLSPKDPKKSAGHFRVKTTHQLTLPQLKPPDIKAPIQTPKSIASTTVREIEPGNYREYLTFQAEAEKKREEANRLNKLITTKVENLALTLSNGFSPRQNKPKPIEVISPQKRPQIEPVKSPRLTKILGKVQKNMKAGGLGELLSHRAASPVDSPMLKPKEEAPREVRFIEPVNPEHKTKPPKNLGALDFFKIRSEELSEENKKFQRSVKERLLTSIQTINNVNDSLRAYTNTFLNQVQSLSEYKGEFKKLDLVDRGNTVQISKKQAKILLSKKFRKTIWFVYDKMRMLKLTMLELCFEKVFSSKPYEDPEAYTFFKYCKNGDTDDATQIVRWNKYIVHNYDETRKTGLHWAIKRKHNRIARMLLESGADPNALDLAGRNPLFMAASADNLIGAKLLLQYRADPNVKTDGKRSILEYAASHRLKSILEKGIEVFISMAFAPDKMKAKVWKLWGLPNYLVRDDEIDDD